MPLPSGFAVVPPDEVDEELRILFKRSVQMVLEEVLEGQRVHRKKNVCFFSVDTKAKSFTVDLCDLFSWLKFSKTDADMVHRIEPGFKVSVFESPFVNGFIVVEALTNVGGCNLFLGSGTHSLFVKIMKRKASSNKTLVGVSIHIHDACLECRASPSESVRLKKCSRCFFNHQARVLYCSKECQKKDYERHRSVCACGELLQDDWRSYSLSSCEYKEQ
jgi:hypothetical protein